MLAAQAMQSFEIWTGRKVPFAIMIDALNRALMMLREAGD
jgi:shikimate 5-dehydrogenase